MIHKISSRLSVPKVGQIEMKEAGSKANCGKFAHCGETLCRCV